MPPDSAPSFTPNEVVLIKQSFAVLSASEMNTAGRFYKQLFVLEPGAKRLFHGDMRQMGQKFISMMTLVVESLSEFDQLIPTLRELGARHVGYGVRDQHYAKVGEALLWAFKDVLKERWTAETAAAWAKAFAAISSVMLEAARAATPVRSD